jgi:hypothetical protein
VTVSETEAEGGYEQRYSLRVGWGTIEVVRRPVSIPPKEQTVCFVDDGSRADIGPRWSAASFAGGEWRQAPFAPTHWTDFAEAARR